jgi:membrane protease YdiL (CAAX protease family)
MGLFFYAALIAVALVWRMGIQGESIFFASAAAGDRDFEPMRDFGVGLIVGLAVIALSFLTTRFTRWGNELALQLAALVGPIGVLDALLLATLSGLGEELFFRGALQPRVGLVAASLLFAAMHFVPRRGLWPWAGFALVMGFTFGLLFEWTGNLIAPVVAHALINGVNLPLLEYFHAQRAGGDEKF